MDNKIKWWDMTVGQQIANAGSELQRAIRRKNKGDREGAEEFCIHAIEMLGYSKLDPKNVNCCSGFSPEVLLPVVEYVFRIVLRQCDGTVYAG